MISLRLELDFFRAGMARLIALESGDLAEQFDAELRVEQLQQLRLRMRGQNEENHALASAATGGQRL